MTGRYNLKNFASGDEYYKSIDFGLDRDLFIDSLVLPNLYRYNLAVQNYWLGAGINKKKSITYVTDKSIMNKNNWNNSIGIIGKDPSRPNRYKNEKK